MNMVLCKSFEDKVLTVRLPKEIDHHCASKVREEIDALVRETKPQRLCLDLTATEFMDSSGLGLILGRARIAKENNIEYELKNPNSSTRKILFLAGVDKIIKVTTL